MTMILNSILARRALTYCFALFCFVSVAAAAESGEQANVDNFVRAESDHMFRANMKAFQVRFGEFTHLREPTTPE